MYYLSLYFACVVAALAQNSSGPEQLKGLGLSPPPQQPHVLGGMAETMRRSPSSVQVEAVVTALEGGATANMLKNRTAGNNMITYSSVDFKRGISHEDIAAHEIMLHNLLKINPTGIFTQKHMHTSLVQVLKDLNLVGEAEVEAYKIRVMLAHLRLMSTRNLPPNLPEHVAAACTRLLSMLAMELAGPQQAPTHYY